MPWYAPKTNWVLGDLVPESEMNEIGHDLNFLKAARGQSNVAWSITNPTTTSTSFVEMSSAISRTITPINNGQVLVHFQGRFSGSGAIAAHFDLYRNQNGGAFSTQTQAQIWGEVSIPSGEFRLVNLMWFFPALALNVPHVIRPMWRMISGTSITLGGNQGFMAVIEL